MDNGFCADCRRPKRTPYSIRCRACTTRKRHRDGGYRPQPTDRVTLACQVCAALFEVQRYRADQAKTCSVPCANELRSRTLGVAHPLFVPKQRMGCENCGTVCEVKPSLVARFRFCSRECTGAWVAHHMPRVSSLERRVAVVLDALKVDYEQQVKIGRFVADFVIGQTVVEVDGAYWHSKPTVVERDARKDVAYRAAGYDVIRLPEADVKASAFDVLLALA